ncbi:carbonic anhydrase family protein, putative [Leishmania tarentolae]|uniref:carbonic anhydrase n=1 Tax=Leishmania tarentolae TaxID=5689 RepID=A0A640K967_LEITA|nr:carbonic anhydrase family protein, putative [Leishmania tarentolae]
MLAKPLVLDFRGALRRTDAAAAAAASMLASAATVVESRRTHFKASHPPYPLSHKNGRACQVPARLSPSRDLSATSPCSTPTSLCSCGCPHPIKPTLDVPSMNFSTTPERLCSRRVSERSATATLTDDKLASIVGGRLVRSVQRAQPPRGSGIQPLLDFNKHWAGEIVQLNPDYFVELAKQQKPQYLWIGCSDSRVPANEIVGLYPGDIFVHRNIANIVCNSDLNALAVIQYAIDCLKVEHVIVSGHYKCGGVTAALYDDRVGLADHWILHVSAVKKRHWRRMLTELPTRNHLDALCELNVLAQMEHVVETHLIQRVWAEQNAEDAAAKRENRPSQNRPEDEVEIHGWVYGLADGLIRPLLTLNRRSNTEKEILNAVDALFWRYGQL